MLICLWGGYPVPCPGGTWSQVQGGGGTQSQVWGGPPHVWGVTPFQVWGGTHLMSGGIPSQVWEGGTWGTPHHLDLAGVPTTSDLRWGTPLRPEMGYPPRPEMGYPPRPGWGTTPTTSDLRWTTPYPQPEMGYPSPRNGGQSENITFRHPSDAGVKMSKTYTMRF